MSKTTKKCVIALMRPSIDAVLTTANIILGYTLLNAGHSAIRV